MDARELNKYILISFPNLKTKYDEETGWQEGDNTGSHIIYGDVFTPYALEIIKGHNISETEKIFEFIEKILKLDDVYADNVIAVSVLEGMIQTIKENPLLYEFIGSKTLSQIENLI